MESPRQATYQLNWKPGKADPRDYKYSSIMRSTVALPTSVSARQFVPEVFDQGQVGSCTGNAGAMVALHRSRKQGRQLYGSRLQLYYDARELINETGQDAGAYIRDIYKGMTHKGVAPESIWPYIESRVTVKPTPDVYAEAEKTKAEGYHAVSQDLNELKTCLAEGNIIQFGFIVYSSFMYGQWNKIMPVPAATERAIGGHSMVLIGYDDAMKCFEAKNSWGVDWKDKGHVWIPYELVTSDMFADFFMLEKVTPAPAPTPTPDNEKSVVDLRKIILKEKDLARLSELMILRIGAEMHLNTDAKKSKSWNCKIIAGALGL